MIRAIRDGLVYHSILILVHADDELDGLDKRRVVADGERKVHLIFRIGMYDTERENMSDVGVLNQLLRCENLLIVEWSWIAIRLRSPE